MKFRRMKKKVFEGEFYGHVMIISGKDDDGDSLTRIVIETSTPYRETPPETKPKKRRKKTPPKA